MKKWQSVNKYAVEAGIVMGRSTYQMKKYSSIWVLKGLGAFDTSQVKKMSEELASLAVDIGSFKNVADDEVFNAHVVLLEKPKDLKCLV